MSNVVFFNSYKLKEGVSVPEFLLTVDKLINEYISKQKGYISFNLLADGEVWADSTTFETMDDAKKFAKSCEPNELAEKFYSFLNLNSCKTHYYSIERSY